MVSDAGVPGPVTCLHSSSSSISPRRDDSHTCHSFPATFMHCCCYVYTIKRSLGESRHTRLCLSRSPPSSKRSHCLPFQGDLCCTVELESCMLIALSVVDTFEPTVLMHQEVTAPTHAAQQEVAAASTTWFPGIKHAASKGAPVTTSTPGTKAKQYYCPDALCVNRLHSCISCLLPSL